MKNQKIYIAQFDGFPNYWAIFTSRKQYRHDPESPLFEYENHIMVNRKVTRKEAELLLEVVKHNGSGKVCGGDCEFLTEL